MVYSPAVSNLVCSLIVAGHSLRAIGAAKGLPSKATVMRWLRDPRKINFLDAYRRAKWVQSIMVAEEIGDVVRAMGTHRGLGQWGGRVNKLWLKTNDAPTGVGVLSQAKAERERRARLKYAVALSPNM